MSVDCPPVSALPESSTMSDTSTTHQPRTSGRTPGTHTPRHVQWASAVDEEEVVGRQRDREPEGEVASAHELDEAGLDVRCGLLIAFLLTLSFVHSQPPSKHLPMLSNATTHPPHHLTHRPDRRDRIHPPPQSRPYQLLRDFPRLRSMSPARLSSNPMNVQDSQHRALSAERSVNSPRVNYMPLMSSARTPGTRSQSVSIAGASGPLQHGVMKAQITKREQDRRIPQ
jgi:hypothetical protein